MIDIKGYGYIEQGAFYPRNSKSYLEQLREVGNVSEVLFHITGANQRTPNQNNYCFAVCDQIAHRMQQDGWDVDSYMVYKRIEQNYCQTEVINEKTENIEVFIKPLKKQPTDRFAEIVDTVRMKAMERYPDIYIKLPHEYYGLTLEAYELWRKNAISFFEAKKQSQ